MKNTRIQELKQLFLSRKQVLCTELCDTFGEGRGLFDALTVLQTITFEEIEALFSDSFSKGATAFTVITPDQKNKED